MNVDSCLLHKSALKKDLKVLAAILILSFHASALDISLEKKDFYPDDAIQISVETDGISSGAGSFVLECTLRSESRTFIPKTSAKRVNLLPGAKTHTNYTFAVLESYPVGRYFIDAQLRDPSKVLENASAEIFIYGKKPSSGSQQIAPQTTEKNLQKNQTGWDLYLTSVIGIVLFAMAAFMVVLAIKYRKLARDKKRLEEEMDAQQAKEKVVDLGLNLIRMENAKIRTEEKRLDKDLRNVTVEWNEIEGEENRWEKREDNIIAREINPQELKREETIATQVERREIAGGLTKEIERIRLERDVEGIKKQIGELEGLKKVRDDYMQRIRSDKLRVDHELRELEKQKETLKKEMDAIYRDPQEVRKAEVRTAAYHRRIERDKAKLEEERERIENEEKKVEEERKKMEKDLKEIRMLWEDLQGEIDKEK